MTNGKMRWGGVIVACAVLGMAPGCSRDDATAPTLVRRTQLAVQGVVRSQVTVVAPDGHSTDSYATARFETPLNPAARTDSSAREALVFRAGGDFQASRQDFSRDGHQFSVEPEPGQTGAPPRALRVYVDGQLVAESHFTWRRDGAHFILKHRETRFLAGGREIGRSSQDLDDSLVTIPDTLPASVTPFGDRPMMMAYDGGCWLQALILTGATAAVAAAGVAFAAAPSPTTFSAVTTAIAAWDAASTKYLNCIFGLAGPN